MILYSHRPSLPIHVAALGSLLAAVLLFARLDSQAQTLLPRAEHFSIQNGLAEWTPISITQDPSGMIWIATENGLQRFDGYTFLDFNRSPENTRRISQDVLEHIEVFQDSLLFIKYRNNSNFFDLLSLNNFSNKTVSLDGRFGLKGEIETFYADTPNKKIYALTSRKDSLYLFEYQRQRFHIVWSGFHAAKVQNQEFKLLALPGAGAFFLHLSEEGLLLIRAGRIQKSWTYDSKGPNSLPSELSMLFKDKTQKVWISLKNTPRLYAYDSRQDKLNPVLGLPDGGEYSHAYSDDSGNLLLIQSNGRGRFPRAEGIVLRHTDGGIHSMNHLLHYTRYPIVVHSRHFNQTIFWGTPLGLKIFQNAYTTFKHYLAKDIGEDEIGTSTRGMSEDKTGNIYLCAENSYWYRINQSDGSVDTITLKDIMGRQLDVDCGLQVYADDNYVWGTGCSGSGKGALIQYHPARGVAKSFEFPKRLFHFVPIDQSGLLLVGSDQDGSELLYFDFKKQVFQSVFKPGKNPFQGIEINYLFQKEKHLFWICTNRGLFEYNRSTGHCRELNPDGKCQFRNFQTAQSAGGGKYWLGTTYGLFLFDPKTRQLKHFDKSDGLPSDWICGILNDSKGNTWITTYHGLSRYNPVDGVFQNFTIQHGLSTNSLNRYSFLKDHRGRLYIGSANGINSCHPDSVPQMLTPPKPVLTQASWLRQSENNPYQISDPASLSYIELPPDAFAIDFEFALPVFYKVKDNRFRVRLDGTNEGKGKETWIFLGNQNQIRFKKLQPGSYTLHVLGADPQGNWTTSTLTIPIHVTQYFYQNWIFKGLVLLLSIGIVLLIYRAYWRQRLQVEQLRTRLSSDIHDEVSGLLAGIAMQSELLSLRTPDPTIRQSVQKITEVSRKAMTKLGDVLWSVDARRDKLEDVLHRMQEDADFLFTPLQIDYTFTTIHLPPTLRIEVQKRQDLYFIYKELINNIVKHSRATSVSIHLEMKKKTLILQIKDNGQPGAEETDNTKNGQGLQNIRMRAQRLHATFRSSKEDGWFSVLEIPDL